MSLTEKGFASPVDLKHENPEHGCAHVNNLHSVRTPSAPNSEVKSTEESLSATQ